MAIRHAAQAWNAVPSGQPRLHFVSDPGPAVTIKFCRGRWRGDIIDLGKSQFTASLHDGTVAAATVELNECDHTFTGPDEASAGRFDLQSVLTHELGHVLGLGHSDNRAAIMYPNGGGVGVRKPNIEDETTLAIIYFGRAATRTEPTIATGGAWEESAQSPTWPRPDDAAPALALSRPVSSPPEDANAARDTMVLAPADQVFMLSLTTSGGREVRVYTCEPTLLPPISLANSARDSRRLPVRRARIRAR